MFKWCSRAWDGCRRAAASAVRAVWRGAVALFGAMGFLSRAIATGALALAMVLGTAMSVLATDPPALNFTQIGVDPAELASQAAIALGGVVTVVIGFALLFIAARKAVRWFRGV